MTHSYSTLQMFGGGGGFGGMGGGGPGHSHGLHSMFGQMNGGGTQPRRTALGAARLRMAMRTGPMLGCHAQTGLHACSAAALHAAGPGPSSMARCRAPLTPPPKKTPAHGLRGTLVQAAPTASRRSGRRRWRQSCFCSLEELYTGAALTPAPGPAGGSRIQGSTRDAGQLGTSVEASQPGVVSAGAACAPAGPSPGCLWHRPWQQGSRHLACLAARLTRTLLLQPSSISRSSSQPDILSAR